MGVRSLENLYARGTGTTTTVWSDCLSKKPSFSKIAQNSPRHFTIRRDIFVARIFYANFALEIDIAVKNLNSKQ